jgi:G3E family GTPase
MSAPKPIPLFVLTGFLGAGKTSLLNQLLQDPALAGTLVIINEFGEIGLDHLFIDVKDETTVLLSSGCLCCTVRGELVSTLEDVLRDLDNKRMPPITRVMIETTGLADPAPVLQSVLGHPYLSRRYYVQGVITLVDAVNGLATLAQHDEAFKQAALADVLVLSKTDLCDNNPTLVPDLVRRLQAINPFAPCLDRAKGEAHPATLLSLDGFVTAHKDARIPHWLAHDRAHPHHHDHDHAHPHTHDPNCHNDQIRAFALTHAHPVPASALEMFIDLLRSAHGPNLLRVKGLVCIAEDPARPFLLHGVQHVFHPPERLPQWPDSNHTTRLVFITKDLDRSFVERLWLALTGTPQIDQADGQALSDNPLSLRGQ